ncbi:MAG: hypothetical protein WBW81_00270 [Methylocella sp.]
MPERVDCLSEAFEFSLFYSPLAPGAALALEYIAAAGSARVLRHEAVTFPFILLSDHCSIYCSAGTAQAGLRRSDWRPLRDRSKPLAFEPVRAIFHLAGPRGEHEPALQNFHAIEMAV